MLLSPTTTMRENLVPYGMREHAIKGGFPATMKKRICTPQGMRQKMTKRNISDRSYTRLNRQGKMYMLRLNGFWGNLIVMAALLLLLPLVMAFFLLFVVGLVAAAVIGIGYAWWNVKKHRPVHAPYKEDAIELAASEYHALEEPTEKAHDTEEKR